MKLLLLKNKKHTQRIVLFFSVSLTLFLTGCGLDKPVQLPPEMSYTLSSPYLAVPKRSRSSATLLVSNPIASPGYQSNEMIYVQTAYQLKAFAHNRWIAPPAEMLLPVFAQQLRSKGYFKAVITPPFSGVTRYRLDTQLLTLRQEFLQPTSFVRLVVQATLIQNQTNQVIASRRFQVMVSAPGNNPYSGVLAANKAVSLLSKRLSVFVVRHSAK